MHYGVKYLQVRISFLKIKHILIEHRFRRIPIFRAKPAVVQIAKLHHDFIEQLALTGFFDVFVIVGNLAVSTFLLCVVFRKSRAENPFIKIVQIDFRVGNVVRGSRDIYIVGGDNPVVMVKKSTIHTK